MAPVKAPEGQDEYTVGWIAALPVERAAVTAMLDEQYARPSNFEQPSTDTNCYTFGRIGDHNVVIASLAAGVYGTTNATTTALGMLSSFPQIRFGLLVGIGAGVPNDWQDIRLGDVVVSQPNGNNGGIVQYDLGRATSGGRWERRDFLARPPEILLKALGNMQAEHELGSSRIEYFLREAGDRRAKFKVAYAHPGIQSDRLFEPTYLHLDAKANNCKKCDSEKEVKRLKRDSTTPQIHYGIIGSGNTLVKDATTREKIIEDMGLEIICFEMEAAGLMNHFPCLVIRGISDYADSHKNFGWQHYASGTASAYAKELLAYIPATEISTTKRAIKVLDEVDSVMNYLNIVEERKVRQDRERKVNELLQSLHSCPYTERKDRNTKRVEGTCEWFTNHPQFWQWNNSDSASVLWVSADPGCGKSTLAKYLIDEFLSQPGNRTVSYFFFKDDFDDQRSAAVAICSILRQLFIDKPHLLGEWIVDEFKRGGTGLLESFQELWKILIRATAQPEAGVIICVFDALDECCDRDRRQIFNALCDLNRSQSNKFKLKFLVTSRPYDHIRRGFLTLKERLSLIHLSGEDEVEVEKISEEIKLVIQHRIRRLSKAKSLQPDECRFLQEQLLSVQHRTYLWVYLTLGVIEETPGFSRGNVRRTISDLPKTVDDAYEKILARSSDGMKARKLLQVVTAARRPLSVYEMSIALTIEEAHKTHKELKEEMEPKARFQNTVRDLCGLFVIVINDHVYLLHQTAKEFLVPNNSSDFRQPRSESRSNKWKHSLQLPDSDRRLAEICVWYLALNDLYETFSAAVNRSERMMERLSLETVSSLETKSDKTDSIKEAESFLFYAAENWSFHFRKAGILSKERITLAALALCNTDSKEYRVWSAVSREVDFRSRRRFQSLHIASNFGIDAVAEILISTEMKVKGKKGPRITLSSRVRRSALEWQDSQGRTPLSLAAKQGHKSTVSLLLARHANIDTTDEEGRTPLSLAAEQGRITVVSLLLARKANINSRDKSGRTPLLWAAEQGHARTVRLLLERGDIVANTQDKTRQKPAFRRASWWHKTTVRLSLSERVDVDLKDRRKRTPLSWAARYGSQEVVRLLLENGAKVDAKDSEGRTPLSWAAEARYGSTMMLLLERGAAIDVKDLEGRTPLSWAARKGSTSAVMLLLEKGAEADTRDANGRTPLFWAAGDDWKTSRTVTYLLEKGAEVDIKDVAGRTALSWAVGQSNGLQWCLHTIQLLLDYGTDINARDKSGLTPLSWAEKNRYGNKAAGFLRDRGATT